MKLKLAAALTAALLSGCAATGDDYVTGVRPTLEMHPILGQLTISESDLLGPDANENGVRDEIDKTILTAFSSDQSRKIATLFAVEVSKAMIIGLNNKAPSEAKKQEYVAAATCLDSVLSGASNSLLTQTIRTKNRADAMARWSQLAGTLSAATTDIPCRNV